MREEPLRDYSHYIPSVAPHNFYHQLGVNSKRFVVMSGSWQKGSDQRKDGPMGLTISKISLASCRGILELMSCWGEYQTWAKACAISRTCIVLQPDTLHVAQFGSVDACSKVLERTTALGIPFECNMTAFDAKLMSTWFGSTRKLRKN